MPADPHSDEVPAELRRAFWSLVAVFNVAVFAAGVGVLLIAFDGRWLLGGASFLAGAAAFAAGYRRYRARRNA